MIPGGVQRRAGGMMPLAGGITDANDDIVDKSLPNAGGISENEAFLRQH